MRRDDFRRLSRSAVWAAVPLALAFLVPGPPALGGDGTPLDPSFGGQGWKVAPKVGGSEYATSLTVDSADRILVTGISDGRDMPIWVFKENGDPDPDFNSVGYRLYQDQEGQAIAVDQSDRILVAGRRGADAIVWRYLPDGTEDLSFGTEGMVTLPIQSGATCWDMKLDSAQRIVVAGGNNAVPYIAFVARLTSNGVLDEDFGTDGVTLIAVPNVRTEIEGVNLDPSGRILVSGSSGPSNSAPSTVWRFLESGTLDPAFGGGNGYVTHRPFERTGNFVAWDTAVLDEGKILVAGGGPSTGIILWQYLDNGVLDTSFHGVGWKQYSDFGGRSVGTATGLILSSEGKPFIEGGIRGGPSPSDEMLIFSVREDGSLDGDFATPDGFFVHDGAAGFPNSTDFGHDITTDRQGRLLVPGASSTSSGLRAVVWRVLARPNDPPQADAGENQSIHAGDMVVLDGSGSSDDSTASEDLVYNWTFSSSPVGSQAAFTGNGTAFPTFDADLPGEYVIELVVTDGGGLTSEPDSVTISSDNVAPNADAGEDQATYAGDLVTLDGTASDDPDGDGLTFSWTLLSQPDGSAAVLDDPQSPVPTFIPDLPGEYQVELVVRDDFEGSAPDTVTVMAIVPDDFACNQAKDALNYVAALPTENVTTKGNKTALDQFLKQACAHVQKGNPDKAIEKFQAVIDRADGCVLRGSPDGGNPVPGMPPLKDYVIDCGDQERIYGLLQAAIDSLSL